MFNHVQWPALDFPVNTRDVLPHNAQGQQVQPAETKDRHGQGGETEHAQLGEITKGLQDFFDDQKSGVAQAGHTDDGAEHCNPLQGQIGEAKQPVQCVAEQFDEGLLGLAHGAFFAGVGDGGLRIAIPRFQRGQKQVGLPGGE